MSQENESLLTHDRVKGVLFACLYEKVEMDADGNPILPADAMIIEGVATSAAFDPKRVEENKPRIRELLEELPAPFFKDTGGGWSFLNACLDKHNRHWGEHQSVDALLLVGIAAGYVTFAPKEMWSVLPGGVPYFTVDTGRVVEKVPFEVKRGRFVRAFTPLDPEGANVKKGDVGVVVAEAGHNGSEAGPLVRWQHGTTCNVYEGQVEVLKGEVDVISEGEYE